jgi:predicted tellurium resistance membrane protein TerC
MDYSSSAFPVAVLQIIGLDIILSGNNAPVTALARRSIP